jgi:hypothetical protein
MDDQKRREAVEKALNARVRHTGRHAANLDYLNFEGHVRATRPASKMEVAMWELLIKGVGHD